MSIVVAVAVVTELKEIDYSYENSIENYTTPAMTNNLHYRNVLMFSKKKSHEISHPIVNNSPELFFTKAKNLFIRVLELGVKF
jgi:hypothetical protein